MRRARRWFIAFAAPLILAGCASSSSDVGGESFTGEEALWTCFYIGAMVLGVVGAKALLEANE